MANYSGQISTLDNFLLTKFSDINTQSDLRKAQAKSLSFNFK